MKTYSVLIATLAATILSAGTPVLVTDARASGEQALSLVSETDSARVLADYRQRLEDYRKNRMAYEADPTVWTSAVPEMPPKPELVALKEFEKNRTAYEADPSTWTAEIPTRPLISVRDTVAGGKESSRQ